MKFGECVMFEPMNITEVVDFSEYNMQNLDKTVLNVVQLLQRRNMSIATAESCTGGLLSAWLTSIDGASTVFECGVCSYSERIKHSLLHVPESILDVHSAVSWQTAAAMTDGIFALSSADICISVTGYAGPQGGTQNDPVGSIYVGLRIGKERSVYHLQLWNADGKGREFNRSMTAAFVFQTVEQMLMEDRI